MIEIKVNISAPELSAAVLALAAAVGGKKESNIETPAPQPQIQPIQQIPPQLAVYPQQPVYQQQPQTAPIQQAPVQNAVPTAPQTYTQEQLAVAATQLMDAGRQGELIGLLSSFGVPALTSLKPEQYGTFATQLRAMGAKI